MTLQAGGGVPPGMGRRGGKRAKRAAGRLPGRCSRPLGPGKVGIAGRALPLINQNGSESARQPARAKPALPLGRRSA